MKFETLLKKYKKIGYTPINAPSRDEEVNNIIKFLYDTYKFYVGEHYMDMDFSNGSYMKFNGCYRYNIGTEHSNNFYCDKHFDSPFDARYDALMHCIRGLRFQYEHASIEVDK